MSSNDIWNYVNCSDGVVERNINIKAKKEGRPLRITQLTDLHFNYCNQKDIEENDPVLMSTLKKREWLKNGESVENAKRSLEHAKSSDAIVITGDILDYLSYGCEELAIEYVFKPYPNVIASLGNHEAARKVQGELPDTMSYAEKSSRLKAFWNGDLHYSSTILDERVMIIQMDNCSEYIGFRNDQIEPFVNDLNLARKNGYIALLFFHVHICPNDEKYSDVHADKIGDRDGANINLNKHGIIEARDKASAKIIDIIKSNPDIIKGCFCGHMHSDFYCELTAKNGKTIPQYLLIGTPYGKGHILNIHIK